MLSVRDIAWLAGIVEGEGCIAISHTNRRTTSANSIRIHVGMTDKDVVERVAAIFGTRMIGPHYSKDRDGHKRKPQYRAVVTQGLAASWMMTIYPLLGERRRQAAGEALAFWRQYPLNGRMFVPHRLGHPDHGTRYALPGSYSTELPAQTHCKRGHELKEDNIYRNDHGRSCRQCQLDKKREQYENDPQYRAAKREYEKAQYYQKRLVVQ